ncbi:hypothetical protein GpartN1_g2868.t1 [Galdieria partita]|uniref:EngB-type G domain-containing protein n=1 Tax=Galdieria partita TaxID=83374 RepID=A0A9C7UQ14_9RHOD|nr:hypothetical protein GpartN1_g1967.t1 [Galdieria partita]GJQ11077.1 hypothetical protein GpartN1_g2868.t1 [Galdieria partita]
MSFICKSSYVLRRSLDKVRTALSSKRWKSIAQTTLKKASPSGRGVRSRLRRTPIDPKILETINELEVCSPRRRRTEYPDQERFSGRVFQVWSRGGELYKRARVPEEFPEAILPEVALIGRSNVGKSCLVNSLVGGTKSRYLAETKDFPGTTRELGFYVLRSGFLSVVDLPGYGFAFAEEQEKKQWLETVKEYLQQRKTLKRLLILLDARHGIMKADRDMLQFFKRCKVKSQFVLNKCDLVKDDELARRIYMIREEISSGVYKRILKNVMMTSSHTRAGAFTLQAELTGLALRPSQRHRLKLDLATRGNVPDAIRRALKS